MICHASPVGRAVSCARAGRGPPGNLKRRGPLLAQVDHLTPRPMVLALAESALTGYFLEGGVRDNAVTAGTLAADLDDVFRASVPSPKPLDVVVGFYEIWNNK